MIRDGAESTTTTFKREISESDRVLDIGTKNGEKVRDMAGTVVAIDINRERMVESGVSVDFALADGTRLPFTTNSSDYVHCDQVLEHLPKTGAVVAETARVLDSDGLAFFGFPNRLSLQKPHTPVPGYYTLLPRRVGVALAPYLLDDQDEEYYKRANFPLSPVVARWHFHRHFGSVQYPMRMDPRPRADSVRTQELIWWANTVAKLPPQKWVGELLWPSCNYVLADPKSNPDEDGSPTEPFQRVTTR